VEVLFAPEINEIYPPGFRTYVNVEGLSERLEGRSRPGHFRGVATVVLKLFEIVAAAIRVFRPQRRAAGAHPAADGHRSEPQPEIVVCPIVRELDGLALSSRNTYLNSEERRAATVLQRALSEARRELNAGTRDALQLQTALRKILSNETLARVDYVEMVDAESFEPVSSIGARPVYALLAVFIGKTRLIDNLFIEPAAGQNAPASSL